MRWLLFLSRLAFVSGLFFLLSGTLLVTDWMKDDNLKSTIIIIGYFMGMLLFPLVNICYFFVLLIRKKLNDIVPLWLSLANLLFLFLLLFYIFYLNDPYYHQK